jgi:GT2 family glycosyltransferase
MGTGKEVSERVLCILTCHNRRETTLRAVRQIAENAARPDILVVDNGSTDGTSEALNSEWPEVEVIEGSGELYWGGGMRRAIDAFLADDQAYLLWLNDDVDLGPDALTMSLDELRTVGADVLVGCCVDHTGALSYGGETRVSSLKPVSFARSEPGAEPDTFNGNFVLFKRAVVESVGNIDPAFPHRMGDYDYGLRTARAGFRMRVASKPIGVCERNQTAGSFLDTTLPRRERLKHMLSVKGMPPGPWFTFCIRHARWLGPLVFIKPYLNIIFRR